MTRSEWRNANGYDIFIARCNVCRYFKVIKTLANNYGECRLMKKETIQDGCYNIVAHTACCDRFLDKQGYGLLIQEPTKEAAQALAV